MIKSRIQLFNANSFKIGVLLFTLIYQTFGWGQTISNSDKEIKRIIEKLTVEEKTELFYGFMSDSIPKRFEIGGIEKLGVPAIKMLDGPVGLRDFDDNQPTTALPSTLLLSCTWDTLAVRKYANVLAEEMVSLDKQVLFGPGINLMRSPLGGRNFEYMGEDPLLTGNLATVYIDELQKHNIAGCAKHFVANDIDHLRHFVSSEVDERTLRELHLYPFEKVIKEANVWTIMVGNNLVNGKHMAENSHLTNDILRKELGFDGIVISDWRAAYDTHKSFEGGLDLSMGFCAYVYGNGNLLKAVKSGEIKEAEIDERLYYILKLYQRTDLLKKEKIDKPFKVNTIEHQKIASDIASQGMVLLKNRNQFLPLAQERTDKIIVTGPALHKVVFGKGSSTVKSEFSITPLDGLKKVYGDDKILVINDLINSKTLDNYAAKKYPVLYFAEGPESSEGRDLKNLDLIGKQDEEIQYWSNKFSVGVVVQSASAINLSGWSNGADAILCAWFSGQATGQAIAKVLSGNVNPSGKLSFTLAKTFDDYAPHALGQWPPYPVMDTPPLKASFKPEGRYAVHGYSTDYEEGVLHGYRWFDAKTITPAYEFGFGLSYSSFLLSDVELTVNSSSTDNPEIVVKGIIKNTGSVSGAEVVQVYVGDIKSSVLKAPKELKAFQKIILEAGESKEFSFKLGKEAFHFWDTKSHKWNIEEGKFVLSIGTSSRQIHTQEWIDIK